MSHVNHYSCPDASPEHSSVSELLNELASDLNQYELSELPFQGLTADARPS